MAKLQKGCKNWQTMDKEKRVDFLKILDVHFGNVRKACEICGVKREKYNKWMNNNPDFAKGVLDILENKKDYLEELAVKEAENGSVDMIKYMLTSNAPERGYAQKTIVQNEAQLTVRNIFESIWDKPKELTGRENVIEGQIIES